MRYGIIDPFVDGCLCRPRGFGEHKTHFDDACCPWGVVLVVFFPALLSVVCCANLASGQISDVPGWELIWNDEFDGTTLSTQNWEALDRRDSHNNEKQYYHPNQVTVAGGNLQITAIDTPRQGKAYQSGLITSNDLFGPGRFEARVDLPTSQGMWPAFWLNANDVSWPLGGEIDILENRGSQQNLVSSAYHWQTDPGPCCDQHQYVFGVYFPSGPVDFHAGFHTYAAEWDERSISYYVDGNLYFTVTETPSRPIIETPKNIIVNLAVGGDFGGDPDGSTVWPQTMMVDYVRVWQRQTVVEGDFDLNGVVNGADFLLWQRDPNVGDLADWELNYGIGALATTAAVVGAVPEPSAMLLMVFGGCLVVVRRRARA
jgi:beta-glucanase (GH16 family)